MKTLLLALALLCFPASAATVRTTQAGDITVAATWGGTLPGSTDTAMIVNNCTLAGGTFTCGILIVTNSPTPGQLTVTGTSAINAAVVGGSTVAHSILHNRGTCTINGSLSACSSYRAWSIVDTATLVINGNLTNYSTGYCIRTSATLTLTVVGSLINFGSGSGSVIYLAYGTISVTGGNLVNNGSGDGGVLSMDNSASGTVIGDVYQHGMVFAISILSSSSLSVYGNGYQDDAATGLGYGGNILNMDSGTTSSAVCNWHGNLTAQANPHSSDELIACRGSGTVNVWGNMTQIMSPLTGFPQAIWMYGTTSPGPVCSIYGHVIVTNERGGRYYGVYFDSGNKGSITIFGDLLSSATISGSGTLNTYGTVGAGALTQWSNSGQWNHIGDVPNALGTPGTNMRIYQNTELLSGQ